MPPRKPGGGGGPQVRILHRRLKSCRNIRSVEEIVKHLRSSYPDYSRLSQAALTVQVTKALAQQKQKQKQKQQQSPPQRFIFEEDGEESHNHTPRKKARRAGGDEEKEERLLRIEEGYLKRRQSNRQSSCESTSSSSKEEEDGAVSTSEDAIYSQKLSPKFDLTSKSKAKEKNIEIDIANERKRLSKMDIMISGSGSGKLRTGADISKDESGLRFKDLGGMKSVLEELKMEVLVPLYHPQLPRWLGVRPMSGILLHGPPGCGKTRLAHAIANETGVPFYKISATEVVSAVSGASEENIRELFSKAYRNAPSIVFIDEIDAIASKRETMQREMERRIVTQLLTCMDESHELVQPSNSDSKSENFDNKPGHILVIGATNRPDALDPALRRPGRFDREISLGVPDENARIEILSVLTRKLRLEGSFDMVKIARSTPGFVGADLTALANKAGNLAMKRIIDQRKSDLCREPTDEDQSEDWWRRPWLPEEMTKLTITMADFEEAAKVVQPSSRREGFSERPDAKWEDVGGLDHLRKEFERYIIKRIKFPEDYQKFGVELETGFLLYGPPGCGKTLIAKAVAHEAGANFIHIKGPELLNKYVGESELGVRRLFYRARTCSPCILFFDEVDALTTERGKDGGWVVERLLNQLLIELDGADKRRGVYVIGATNRPEVMDRAILRPGRLGKLLYVPLPTAYQRVLILKALGRKKPLDPSVDLDAIARMEACENFSGADLSALMEEAAMAALEERLTNIEGHPDSTPFTINTKHFQHALGKISPSVSEKEKLYYQKLSERFKAA